MIKASSVRELTSRLADVGLRCEPAICGSTIVAPLIEWRHAGQGWWRAGGGTLVVYQPRDRHRSLVGGPPATRSSVSKSAPAARATLTRFSQYMYAAVITHKTLSKVHFAAI